MPSGSLKNAMWQTPVSTVSPSKATPLASSSARAAVDVGNAERQTGGTWRERLADTRRIEDVERHLAGAELHVALALGLDLEPEHLRVELLRPRDVLGEEGDEVDALDLHHGVVPSGYGA